VLLKRKRNAVRWNSDLERSGRFSAYPENMTKTIYSIRRNKKEGIYE
jgi:hypothetical protein